MQLTTLCACPCFHGGRCVPWRLLLPRTNRQLPGQSMRCKHELLPSWQHTAHAHPPGLRWPSNLCAFHPSMFMSCSCAVLPRVIPKCHPPLSACVACLLPMFFCCMPCSPPFSVADVSSSPAATPPFPSYTLTPFHSLTNMQLPCTRPTAVCVLPDSPTSVRRKVLWSALAPTPPYPVPWGAPASVGCSSPAHPATSLQVFVVVGSGDRLTLATALSSSFSRMVAVAPPHTPVLSCPQHIIDIHA
jgi:hypothetical protein